MEWLIVVVLAVFVSPLVMSIVALARANRAREEVAALRGQLARLTVKEKPAAPREAPPATVLSAPPPASSTPPSPPLAVPVSPPRPSADDAAIEPPAPRPMLAEVAFGGRVASFAGITLLLIGVALMVGYAIKHAWLGPAARVVLGLLGGAALVVVGHVAEVRGKGRLLVLARALTGGGTAIFYFCVFAAYGIYHLIGPPLAAAGLLASAAAALGLAVVYRSQAVAVIGVVGAFLMPLLAGGDDPDTLFLLVYIAVIQLPVMALGLQRNWQWLYNIAFGFTVFYMAALIADATVADARRLVVFAVVYFLEFAALGLLKLRAERADRARAVDIARSLLNSLGLLGAIHALFGILQWQAWTGPALVAAAVVHVGLVRIGWRWFPAFTHDMLALLVGGLTLASLALPIQLDGAWVSCGWSIEGVLLCWLALRARIPLLQVAAFGLGMIGLVKSLFFDINLYAAAPAVFLNARFMSGLLSCILLGAQGVLHGRHARTAQEEAGQDLWKLLPSISAISLVVVWGMNLFWTLGERDPWAWIGTGMALLAVTLASALVMRRLSLMSDLVRVLLVLSAAAIAVNAVMWFELAPRDARLFLNLPFAALAASAAAMLAFAGHRSNLSPIGATFAAQVQLGALAAGVVLVTMELYRMPNRWDQAAVTLWWALCAIALVLGGLRWRRKLFRYAGLVLFGAMTVKALLIDLSFLAGLERIAALLGAGVILLVLSFVYQRAAERLADEEAS